MNAGTWQKVCKWRGHGILALPLRFYIGYIFVLACLHKILHPELFALDVATYDFLPLFLVNIFAIVLPWVELGSGILIIIGWKSRAAALLIVLMMLSFIIAQTAALYKGIDMSCGCFASSSLSDADPISGMTLLRNTFWLSLASLVLFFDTRPLGITCLWEKLGQSWARRSKKKEYR